MTVIDALALLLTLAAAIWAAIGRNWPIALLSAGIFCFILGASSLIA